MTSGSAPGLFRPGHLDRLPPSGTRRRAGHPRRRVGLTRHIPGAVRRAARARDGGRCVECRDDNDPESGHIIPHSRGGANTFGNVQLLCRRCDGEKGDRI
jgi:5-methylcytosine-specific restriction endonuclease McrA